MPEAEAVATICSAFAPSTPGAIWLPSETLAGASMAWAGTLLPSGRDGSGRSPAAAVGASAARRLTVQAADSSAIGTSAVALCKRPKRLAGRFVDIELSPSRFEPPPPGGSRTPTNRLTTKLRLGVAPAPRCDADHRQPWFPSDAPPKRPVPARGGCGPLRWLGD